MPASARRSAMTAVVASFEPGDAVAENVARLAERFERIVVVDDGSSTAAHDVLARLATTPDVSVLRLASNRGIAASLNTGVRAAFAAGAEVVLTLDQDSTVSDDYAEAALTSLDRLKAAGHPLVIIAAGVQSGHPVRPVRYRDHGDRLTPTLEAIQSGLVFRRPVFERVGEFDERLFIDCVDTDWILRAARCGIPTYLARDCRIGHPLGRLVSTRGIRATRSGRRDFAFHPAWRRYYISRNRAVVFLRHGFQEPGWALAGLAGEAAQLSRSIVFGPRKLQQIAAVALGLSAALMGRRGRISPFAAAVLGAPRHA